MNLGTLRELRADNARTHALLTELIKAQQRTNELLATLVEQGKPVQVANSKPAPAPVKATEQPAPTMPTAPKPLAKKPASK